MLRRKKRIGVIRLTITATARSRVVDADGSNANETASMTIAERIKRHAWRAASVIDILLLKYRAMEPTPSRPKRAQAARCEIVITPITLSDAGVSIRS